MCHISPTSKKNQKTKIRNLIAKDKVRVSLKVTWKKIKSHRGGMRNKQNSQSLQLLYLSIKFSSRFPGS